MNQIAATEPYDRFVAASPQGSIFGTSWWLNAVAPEGHRILSVEHNGAIQAVWPIVTRTVPLAGLTIEMAPLTPYLGIMYAPMPDQKLGNRLSRERELADALVSQLPDFGGLYVQFHPGFTYWLPLFWQGFEQTTWYTYILDDIACLETIWDGLRDNVRRDIRKAQRANISVTTSDDLELFLDIHTRTFARQGLDLPYSRAFVRRVDAVCRERDRRRIFIGRGTDGKPHAAVYIVWDERSAYYLMGGGDPQLRKSGATSLVMWEAIRFASTVTRAFDFEGSMIETVERFFRSFGGQPRPHYVLRKVNSPIRVAYKAVQDLSTLIKRKGRSRG